MRIDTNYTSPIDLVRTSLAGTPLAEDQATRQLKQSQNIDTYSLREIQPVYAINTQDRGVSQNYHQKGKYLDIKA
jgi:hypothetical protein